MRNKLTKARVLTLIFCSVFFLVVIVIIMILTRNSPDAVTNSTEEIVIDMSTEFTENTFDPSTDDFSPADEQYITIYEIPEDWQEQAIKMGREYASAIIGNIVAEIDSQAQPQGISPETTIFVDECSYDIVIKGALINGYGNIVIYDSEGAIFAKNDEKVTLSIDEEFRVKNVPRGEYRIVVERLNIPDVVVECLLKIILELTEPKLELPSLISTSHLIIKNPYMSTMLIESNEQRVLIDASKSISIELTEGSNDIWYYLQSGELTSNKVLNNVRVDTTPPVIILHKTEIRDGKVVLNLSVSEYVEYIKINNENKPYGGTPDSDGSFPFSFIGDLSTEFIDVEVCDEAGNITKTTLWI